jgi:hypothetical protein
MERVPHGIVNTADFVRHVVVQVPHVCGGHRNVLGETAVTVDTNDFGVRTDMRVTRSAEQASAIDNMTFGRHTVAFFDIGHQAANLHDVAGKFMADYEWRTAPPFGPIIPVVNVDVGTADAGASDTNQNFVVTNFWDWNIPQGESWACGCLYKRFHVNSGCE